MGKKMGNADYECQLEAIEKGEAGSIPRATDAVTSPPKNSLTTPTSTTSCSFLKFQNSFSSPLPTNS
jgi:hypothetical protein